jgi:tetratricopeptide (TPR) repeat protein
LNNGQQQDILILEDAPLPAWKKKWDEARFLAGRGDFLAASQSYSELLQLRPQVEEILWEYCNVLVKIQDWLSAVEVVEKLLEIDGDRQDYLLLAGKIALGSKEYRNAIDRFGKVYHEDTNGPFSITALKGLIDGLKGAGRRQEAFPLMEQLFRRTPEDKELLQDLAGIAQDLGYLDKARDYYSSLVEDSSADDETMLRASSAFEQSGASKDALAIWETYLERQPAYLPFHKKIADYYMMIGKSRSALPHILFMIDNGVEDDELLLVAGRILLNDEKQPAKALQYLEQYASRHPEDIDTGFQIEKIRTVLADDFISVIEKDGVQMLWDDLVEITPNREAIYLEMADKLEKKGNFKDVLKILQVIHRFHPEDRNNILRIARTHFSLGNYEESLVFQQMIEKAFAGNSAYLLLRAETEEHLGKDTEALRHYFAVLEQDPDNFAACSGGIRLAGQLGLVEELKKLAKALKGKGSKKHLDLWLDYLEGLRMNALFEDAWIAYQQLLQEFQGQADEEEKILLHKVDTLLASRQDFLAEQVLREMLAATGHDEAVLIRLADLAVREKNGKSAREWWFAIQQKYAKGDWKTCDDRISREIFRLNIDILMLDGLFGQVVDEIEALQQQVQNHGQDRESAGFITQMKLAQCRALFNLGEYERCLKYIDAIPSDQGNRVELAVLWFQLSKKIGRPSNAFRELDKMLHGGDRISPVLLFQAAEIERKVGEYEAGLHHIDLVQKTLPGSVRAQVVKADLLWQAGKLSEALQCYHSLLESVGEQKFLRDRALELELRLGNYQKIVRGAENSSISTPEIVEKRSGKKPIPDYWRKLLLARALWTAGEWDAASDIYEHLLDDPVQRDFQTAMEAEQIEITQPPLKKSIWNVISFSNPVAADPLAQYMEPQFVSRHAGTPVDRVTARMYEKYRWQRLIRNEYQAKKAEQRKDIREAERQYKELVDKDASVEGLYDLAQIYGRLGEYGKEAQLYSTIRQYGPAYPELSEAIKRNELLRKPRLSADFEVVEKEGRGGYIDTFRQSVGSTLWFMPALEKEASLEYRRNAYSDSDDVDTIRGHRFVGAYSHDFPAYFDMQLRAGAESMDDYETTITAGTRVNCQLDDHIKAYVLFDQNPVYDTLTALERGIYSQDYETGLIIETPKGIAFGADYRRRRYSDDNSQDQTHLWSGYAIYTKSTTFNFQYDYTTIDNSKESSDDFSDKATVELLDTPLYWSPDEYWEHLATISFQHLLKTYSLTKGTPSYYSLDYSFGFESGQNFTHKMGFEILLEMSTHFLLKGSISYASSDDYEQKGALLSLIYRW